MSRDRSLLRLALATIGFTAAISQLALMRELVAAFYGNELLIGAILAAWLAWTAAGAAWLGRLAFVRPERTRPRLFAAGLALLGLLLPATLALARATRSLLGLTPGVLVGIGPALATVIIILAPFCLASGALFTLGVRLAAETNAGAGRAYVWESAGAVVGGVLFSLALIRWLDPGQIALLVALVDGAVAASILVCLRPSAPPLPRSSAPLLLLLLTPLALLLGCALNQATLRWQWPRLIYAADSPYGRITVEALGSERAFYADGLLAFETQGVSAEEVAHFPLLAHPDPRRVLLIGGGVAGDLREILKHPVEAVTYVELDPLVIEAAREHLPAADSAVLRDPRVRVVTTDGRRYITTTDAHFDVILLDLPEPITGALNRFYTAEFFGEARGALQAGGILALHLPSAENYWNPELTRRNASIYRTLKTAFSHILVLPGERNFLLASEMPLAADAGTLSERLSGRKIQARWVTPDYLNYILTTDRFEQVKLALETASGVRLNHDLAPISYYYGQVLWASMLNPRLRSVFDRASVISLGWIAIPFILGVALARGRRRWAIPFAIACAGFAGMLFELVILFAFQARHGSMYTEVGLIVAAYMGGLALGGSAANGRWQMADGLWPMAYGSWLNAHASAERPERSGRAVPATQSKGAERRGQPSVPSTPSPVVLQPPAQSAHTFKLTLVVVLVLMAVLAGIILLTLTQIRSLPAPAFWLMALIAGCVGGMVYPLAIGLASPDSEALQDPTGEARRSAAAGTLYGADLLGGCLGALLGAAFLVPVLGIPQTCALVALAALAGLVALV